MMTIIMLLTIKMIVVMIEIIIVIRISEHSNHNYEEIYWHIVLNITINFFLITATIITNFRVITFVYFYDIYISAYLAVWYLGNIYYNIYNKKACIALGKNAAGASNAHWALSAVQVKNIRISNIAHIRRA